MFRYAKLFQDWSEADLRAWIRRDRNHPYVILWSTGNEVNDQRKKDGDAVSRRLTNLLNYFSPEARTAAGQELAA